MIHLVFSKYVLMILSICNNYLRFNVIIHIHFILPAHLPHLKKGHSLQQVCISDQQHINCDGRVRDVGQGKEGPCSALADPSSLRPARPMPLAAVFSQGERSVAGEECPVPRNTGDEGSNQLRAVARVRRLCCLSPTTAMSLWMKDMITHTGNKAASARKRGLCVRTGETTDILLNAKKIMV